jgi:hypothetical protein
MVEAVCLFLSLFFLLVWLFSRMIKNGHRKDLTGALRRIIETGGCVVYGGQHLYWRDSSAKAVIIRFNRKHDYVDEEEFNSIDEAAHSFVDNTGIK